MGELIDLGQRRDAAQRRTRPREPLRAQLFFDLACPFTYLAAERVERAFAHVTWTAPRAGEDVNVGAIFRLAPGLLEPPPDVEGAVELVVDADGDAPERHYLVTMHDRRVEIHERDRNGEPAAVVRGSVSAWVRALGPEGDLEELEFDGDRGLADGLLTGFAEAARRSAQAA